MSFWYLATPYSRYAAGIEHAWRDACTQAMILARAGVPFVRGARPERDA